MWGRNDKAPLGRSGRRYKPSCFWQETIRYRRFDRENRVALTYNFKRANSMVREGCV